MKNKKQQQHRDNETYKYTVYFQIHSKKDIVSDTTIYYDSMNE